MDLTKKRLMIILLQSVITELPVLMVVIALIAPAFITLAKCV